MPSRFWRLDDFGGVDLLLAKASVHRYARHSHEGYALGAVEEGAHAFRARGAVWTAVPGRVVIVNPDDAHDGGPSTSTGEYSYRMLYLDGTVLTAAVEGSVGRPMAMPLFQYPVVDDAILSDRLLRVHRALERPESRLERETLLTTALVELVRRHGRATGQVDRNDRHPRAVTLAREYLTEHFAQDLSLAELADVAGTDRFRLLRAFRRSLGLPPHLYQTQLRLRHAKRLLLSGVPAARAAVAAGFADQSHLIRKFKAAYGVTPGQFLEPRNNVQSSSTTRG